MSIIQTIATEIRNGSGGVVASATHTQSGDVEQEFSVVAPGSGNVVVALAVTAADIVAFAIVADKAVTFTINDDGTPDDTFALAADVPFHWDAGGLGACPLTHNITSMKFAKAGAGDAAVRGVFLTA